MNLLLFTHALLRSFYCAKTATLCHEGEGNTCTLAKLHTSIECSCSCSNYTRFSFHVFF